ncbi:hypothetical protein DSL72_003699 [Monilinia vaccinii-corymbosi]|uniref:Uncharacterized protein n=1 Tax=Monilinia vaccinii-corymbosi TaxID=61207 RepID=A0A8A3P6D5_9HELO|nr:hypothetical protein DSL72_003699 [Monilinia vaccinii-corymbosi]
MEDVPRSLYIVRDPSHHDRSPDGVSHNPKKSSSSARDIGFLPFDILALGQGTAFTVTDDIEAARNEVMNSERELSIYELDGRCDEMKRCAIFRATNLREAIVHESTKESILRETEREPHAPSRSRASAPKKKTTAGPSRDCKRNASTKRIPESSPDADAGKESGFACHKVDSTGKPIYIAIPSGTKEKPEKYPFSIIYAIEARKAGKQCLIHWDHGVEPSWVSTGKVDARAIANFEEHKAQTDKMRPPTKGDPFEIIFEEARNEDEGHKLDRGFLVRWTNTGRVTWEVHGRGHGITRTDVQGFLKASKTWKRYQYV